MWDLTEDAPLAMYLGYLDGHPVVTGMLVYGGNLAGIHYLITAKAYRRNGYGTAMMEFLLECARQKGYFKVGLAASPQGEGIYHRLGFKTVAIFKEYH